MQTVVVAQLLVQILTASLVSAQADASCAGVHGASTLSAIAFAGIAVSVTGQANQRVSVPGVGTLILNEQIVGTLSITVNALHLILATGQELILCSCHSAFDCPVGVQSSTWGQIKELYRDVTG